MHITQPTLLSQIKKLEKELDTVLFIRENKKITRNIHIGSEESYIMELIAKTAKNLQNDYIKLSLVDMWRLFMRKDSPGIYIVSRLKKHSFNYSRSGID